MTQKQNSLLTARIISGAFMFAVCAYGFMLFNQLSAPSDIVADFSLRPVLWGMGALLIAATWPAKSFILRAGSSVPENDQSKKLVAHIVASALAESAALFGFILALQTRQFSDFFYPATLAIAALALHLPKQDSFR